jgi:hypothetical protein
MVKPTILMTGIKTTAELIILTYALSDGYNKPNINYFNPKEITKEMVNKDYKTAYQILKNHFGEFVYFIDEPRHTQDGSIIYSGRKMCQVFLDGVKKYKK